MLTCILLLASSALCHSQSARYPPRPQYGRPGYSRPSTGDQEPFVFVDTDSSQQNPLDVLFSWKQVDFTFADEQTRETMIKEGKFIPINNMILDVDVYEDGSDRTVFVTLPRVRPGVPVTLATVSSLQRRGVTLLAPYPDWQSHTPGDCENGITSVFRTHMDQCGRLWVLDSGNNNANGGPANPSRIVCPPQVIVYDVRNNNRLIGKYRIPSSMIVETTMLVTISVDARRSDCSDAFAYIADSLSYKMIVFSLETQQFWRINSNLFFPYPDQSMFNVSGVSFDLMGGVFGLALGPQFGNNRRILYFHCITSVKQSWAETSDLRNQSLWRDNMNAKPRAFNLFSGTRSSQTVVATMSQEGVMFFGLLGSNEISCWNSQTKYQQRNLISLAKDDTTLQFNSGIKVYGNKLYAVTNRLQNYIISNVKEDEVNFRILVGDVQEMTRGTKCAVDPRDNRFDTDYTPNEESVDYNSTTPI